MANVYQMVTDRIIEEMQKGIIPWHKPWVCLGSEEQAISYVSRKPYSLLNQLLLGRPGEWLTWNQIHTLGGSNYSREELVAELGSAMLCNRSGLDSNRAFRNSVAYIQSWLKALKNDPKMIVWAASRAETAAKYILNEI